MKDKLEVGHFIRTIKGIGRIEEITEDRPEIYFNCDTGLTISFIKKDFTQEEMAQYYKHSDNIIDLIEVGDFVSTITGECAVIAGVYNDINSKKYLRLCNCIGEYYEDDIKSVITHEQMEQMTYKVGE